MYGKSIVTSVIQFSQGGEIAEEVLSLEEIGNQLRNARKGLGLSRSQVASEMGENETVLLLIENGAASSDLVLQYLNAYCVFLKIPGRITEFREKIGVI